MGEVKDDKSLSILAVDVSGSTYARDNYHKLAQLYNAKFLEQFSKPHHFVIWSDRCLTSTNQEILNIHENNGNDVPSGGTEPHTIVEYIKRNFNQYRDMLISIMIITDGDIPKQSVEQCSESNKDMRYERVDFVIIDGSDLSVGAPFFQETNLTIYLDEKIIQSVKTCEPFDYDRITAENFDSTKNELSVYIKTKFMSSQKGMLEEIDKIKRLRSRLTKELNSDIQQKQSGNLKLRDEAIQFVKSLSFYKQDCKAYQMESFISGLFNYLHEHSDGFGVSRYSFDQLKVDHVVWKLEIIEEPDFLEDAALAEIEFEDVVTFDNEKHPVLIMHRWNLIDEILAKDKSWFSSCVSCPLLLIDRSSNFLGHVYDIETFKFQRKMGLCFDPSTRIPFTGCLVPDKQFDEYNDYVISRSFFGGRNIRFTKGLMYLMIGKKMHKCEWIAKNVAAAFLEYAFYRINLGRCLLAFTRFSITDPDIEQSEAVACYYCVYISSLLFGGTHGQKQIEEKMEMKLALQTEYYKATMYSSNQAELGRQIHEINDYISSMKSLDDNFKLEQLRKYAGVAMYMLEIVRHFEFQIDEPFIKKRAKLFLNINALKRIPETTEKVKYVLQPILKQVMLGESKFMIAELKDALTLNDLNEALSYLNYDHMTRIPFDLENKPLDTFAVLSYLCTLIPEICPETVRPFFVVNNSSSFYKSLVESMLAYSADLQVQAVDKIDMPRLLSSFKLYISFVVNMKRYPTLEEFAAHVLNQTATYDRKKIRIYPTNIVYDISKIHELYQAFESVPVAEFINRSRNTIRISQRIVLEGHADTNLPKLMEERNSIIGNLK